MAFSVFRADWVVIGGMQGSHRSIAERLRWEEEAQRNEQVFAAFGGNAGYGACADEKQSAMGLSRDKITVCVYKGYIGKGHKEPDPLRAG